MGRPRKDRESQTVAPKTLIDGLIIGVGGGDTHQPVAVPNPETDAYKKNIEFLFQASADPSILPLDRLKAIDLLIQEVGFSWSVTTALEEIRDSRYAVASAKIRAVELLLRMK